MDRPVAAPGQDLEEAARRIIEDITGPHFGVRVGAVPALMASQLGLADGQGLLVGDVTKGSMAERTRVMKHDIIVALNGKAVGDMTVFRPEIREAMSKELTLDIIRKGQRQQLKGAPQAPPHG